MVLFGLGALIDTWILAASGPTETITGTCKQAVEIGGHHPGQPGLHGGRDVGGHAQPPLGRHRQDPHLAGAVKVEPGPVRLQERFDTLQSEFSETAQHKGLVLRFMPTRLAVTSDTILLTRILSNFIANAVKYGRGERIEVRVFRRGGRAVLIVRDFGIGIPAADQARIFERFYRADSARARNVRGSGIGLALVKHIAEAHGGRVEVESAPGRGATFTVFVPSAPMVSPAPEERAAL